LAILEKEVLVTVNPMNMKHYDKLNYKVFGLKGSKIKVQIEDIPEGSSSVRVTKICDECGELVKNVMYPNLIKSRKNTDGKDRCKKCARNYGSLTRKNNVAYENSFEYYAIENNRNALLNHFSSKNNKRPSEISKGNKDEYLWECDVCNSEYKMTLSSKLQTEVICSYCDGRKVNTTNCLHVTHPEIAKLLKYPQRGYEISKGMHIVEELICSNCGNVEDKRIYTVVNFGFNCSRCSDGISYPEKFFVSLLQQSKINFEKEKVFEWSQVYDEDTKKLRNKRYDFYLTNLNIIIEVHGGQHFNKGGFYTLGGRNLNEEIKNDKLKESLAKDNGIHKYMVIDCSVSELNYIKNSILNSELVKYIDLNNIDWLKCHEYACNSLVKESCDLWNEYRNVTFISKKLNLSKPCILKYLKQGVELEWCDYDPKEVLKQNGHLNGKKKSKEVVQFTMEGQYIKTWKSITEAERTLNITKSKVSAVCKGQRNHAGKFKWMYKEDYDRYRENESLKSDVK
jgi:hypothetical protein